MIESNKRLARARLRWVAVAGVLAMTGVLAAPAGAVEGAPVASVTVIAEPTPACEQPPVDPSGGPEPVAAGTTALSTVHELLADTSTVYDFTVPENLSDKIVKCGDVEVLCLLKRENGDCIYMFTTNPRIDAAKCKAKLELLDKDGKVQQTWETNQPAKPDDLLWIGTLYGYLYFEKGKPGTYRLTVTCTP